MPENNSEIQIIPVSLPYYGSMIVLLRVDASSPQTLAVIEETLSSDPGTAIAIPACCLIVYKLIASLSDSPG